MKNSEIKKLVAHLQNLYSMPTSPHKQQHRQSEQSKKKVIMGNTRHHWKANGVAHDDNSVKRLPSGDLDNWEVFRINMSKRSYQYPKKYKGIKIPSVSREFNQFNARDAKGRIPYLYESDIPKIENLRDKMHIKPFLRTNTVRHEIFGFPSKNTSRTKSMIAHTEDRERK